MHNAQPYNERGLRPLRVLFVIGGGGLGGIERHVQCLIENIDRSQIEPHVCVTFSPGVVSDALAATGVPVHVIGAPNGHAIKVFSGLLKIIQENHIDLVHAHLLPFMGSVAMCLKSRVPLVVSVHLSRRGKESLFEKAVHGILSVVNRRVDWWLAVSANTLAMSPSFVRAKGEVFFNPIRLPSVLKKEKSWLTNELSVCADTLLVGMVGRIEPIDAKDWPAFLRVCTQIVDRCPHVHVVAVGDGGLKATLERSAESLQLRGRLHWLGARDDARRIISGLDVFLLTSKQEELPTTLLEAMSVKTPVVGFLPQGGTVEVLACAEGNEPIALLHEARATEPVVADVLALLAGPEKGRAMAERAYRTVEKHFEARAACRRLVDIYHRVFKDKVG